jgi:hypothetical protein
MELQRLLREDDAVFAAFDDIRMHQVPELVAEGADIRGQEANGAVEAAESEELEPAGLHAKLYFAAKGSRRQLWLGSANATERAWQGRNFETVAEMSISREVADAIDEFVAVHSQRFEAASHSPPTDEDEEALESARRALSCQWPLRQRISDQEVEIISAGPPPIPDASIDIEIAALDGAWTTWPRSANRISLPGLRRWQRSDFVQLRVMRGERSCSWVQVAPCEPPPDDERDHALIAQYLDPKTFLIWLRSILADEPARAAGGDWDADWSSPVPSFGVGPGIWDVGLMPTVEEILRSWARDSSAFCDADNKVQAYLIELERRAEENAAVTDVKLLKVFRQTWSVLASELR